ncbi:hydroxyacylglutathione hydrolase-like protein isoform X7 [Oryx dammah]|uniref:hydroxyacylglutathione hydrolase-like protein isoform X7 n=1 Tax=Oryx dammah TaxID=59534 RepID=UPI001A9BE4CC|nr:hydroxyacylglutathione hydrolase-like protein isoform X7 [Oryx dammah]
MKVKVIPVLEDNYMYLVIEERTREAVAVDVAVPKRLLEIVGREGVSLTTVLTTHHHWDHARGNAELARLLPGLVVLGADERICALTRRLAHGEELRVSARLGGTGREPGPNILTCSSATVWGHPRALPPDARPHLGPHELLPVGRGVSGPSRCVLRGCTVRGRLRLTPGGHSSADVPELGGDLGHPAPRDKGILWPRAHTGQPRVRTESGALQRPREGQAVVGQGVAAPPLSVAGRGMRMMCPQCPQPWARNSFTTPS